MIIPGLQNKRINFTEATLNLGQSIRHLADDEGVIVQNIDFTENRGAISGRYGTYTINVAADGTPDPKAVYKPYFVHWVIDEDTGNNYIVVLYKVAASDYRLGYLKTNPYPTPPYLTEVLNSTGGTFKLTTDELSVVSARDPNIGVSALYCTNGVDKPFYIRFDTGRATEFQFGTGNIKIRFFAPHLWRGSIWAFGHIGEQHMIYACDPNDFTKWIDQGVNSEFGEAEAGAEGLYLRALVVSNDRMFVLTTDTIGELIYTGNTYSPFKYRSLDQSDGAFHPRCVIPYSGGVIYLSKKPPYLKMSNGSRPVTLDRNDTLRVGFQRWIDLSDLSNIRMVLKNNQLLINLKVMPANSDIGTDGKRWIACIDMLHHDRNGINDYPLSMWNILAKDIAVADVGNAYGQCYYIDDEAQDIDGTNYYFVRQMLDWYSISAGGVGFGDNRNITGENVKSVTNIWRTGQWDCGIDDFKSFKYFMLDGDWDGTPSGTGKLQIKYRCEKWTDWKMMEITAVRLFKEFPFPSDVYGRTIQFEFRYTDTTSRPLLNGIGVKFIPRQGLVT